MNTQVIPNKKKKIPRMQKHKGDFPFKGNVVGIGSNGGDGNWILYIIFGSYLLGGIVYMIVN